MAFAEITTADIIAQEGTFAFDYDCSGTVYAGQGVYVIGTLQIKAPGTTDLQHGCIGVAAYGQTDGKPVAIYGPGNIVRVRVSGTSTAAGDKLSLTRDGEFVDIAGRGEHGSGAKAFASGVSAIALEAQATDSGIVRVLLI